ncbi:succinylglutamate desuccinylase [Roseateles aquatilis]|uniref:Succinylglutamate desuccinylase n=1 Tax=Roseateles aquatilis TaxID=431061 RepID=A0A246JK82_9BURK|nr:succinylglutamate desuccinylase/aspartoacylase family protein [Roseateles aquatilis]OWQ93007.1 succinylglutamate desuccinylase [Roseateles aquatilis]
MQVRQHPLPSPAPGTRRELVSLHYGQPGQGQKVYIQASLHADELPGMLTAWHLRRQLDALEAAGRLAGEVVLVPMANPIGLSQWWLQSHLGRFESLSGENFNRHYPEYIEAAAHVAEARLGADPTQNVAVLRAALKTEVQSAPADTELKALRKTLMLLACDADVVLDLHCDAQAVMHLYTETPCWPQCEPLAAFLGAGVTLLATDSGDNPFDEACSQVWWKWARHFGDRFPIPQACLSVTVELRGQQDVHHDLAEKDAQAIVDFLTWRGVIAADGAAPVVPAAVGDARPLAGSMPIQSPVAGVLTFLREVGETVRAGDVIAHVIDPITASVTELKSPVDGLLFARDTLRLVTTGARVAKVAGREATRIGKLLGAR